MLITELIEINDTTYISNYSDKGIFIERDGIKYAEAIEPVGKDRIYTETEEVIPNYESEMVE